MEKTNEKKRMAWSFDGFIATVTFAAGHTFTLDLEPLFNNSDMMLRLFAHGCKQKISDAIAGTGDMSDLDKADLMQTLYLQLLDGEWSTRKEAQPKVDVKSLRANLIANGVPEAVADQIIADSKKTKPVKK